MQGRGACESGRQEDGQIPQTQGLCICKLTILRISDTTGNKSTMQEWVVSLAGTQAEANALMEECARLILSSTKFEGCEELPWAATITEICKRSLEVVATQALNVENLNEWKLTKVCRLDFLIAEM